MTTKGVSRPPRQGFGRLTGSSVKQSARKDRSRTSVMEAPGCFVSTRIGRRHTGRSFSGSRIRLRCRLGRVRRCRCRLRARVLSRRPARSLCRQRSRRRRRWGRTASSSGRIPPVKQLGATIPWPSPAAKRISDQERRCNAGRRSCWRCSSESLARQRREGGTSCRH